MGEGEGEGGSIMGLGWEGRFSILRMSRRGTMGGDFGGQLREGWFTRFVGCGWLREGKEWGKGRELVGLGMAVRDGGG